MKIDIRKPGIQVLLKKNVGRATVSGNTPLSTRYAGASTVLDLTPYLGESGSVRVTKSVREPAGAFSIVLADAIDMEVQDTLYSVIEPMDSIEIYMSNGSTSSPVGLPIMMRGFVSRIQRTEAMGADGKPRRAVVVSGQDYGKILQILQIYYMPNSPADVGALITSFPFYAKFGAADNVRDAGPFMQEVFNLVVNPYITNLRQGRASQADGPPVQVPLIQTDIQVQGAKVSPFGVGGWRGGAIYSLLTEFCDVGAWNEFFIEDRENAPYAVFRPNPFVDASTRRLIMPGAKMPAITDITRADVVSLSPERTDQNVANYFWVDAPRFSLNYGETVRAIAFQSAQALHGTPMYVKDYGNIDPKLYGDRRMWEQTQQAGPGETNGGNGTPDGSPRDQNRSAAIDWINQRRRQLYDQNKDNVVFESGSMRLKGNEAIRAGTYVRLSSGDMQHLYYAVSVTHDFTPFGSYFTSVQFERGTGFVDRAVRAAQQMSPYWSETTWKNG